MATSISNTTTATSDCPCIDSSEVLREYVNCEVGDTGEPGIRYQQTCLPLTFGASQCAPHDVGADPRCSVSNSSGVADGMRVPEFCGEHWCYVDLEACRVTPEQIYRSKMFDAQYPTLDLYYSYSVCNASADSFLSYQTTESVQDVTLRATLPNMRELVHFKLNENGDMAESKGPEYYNDDIPWQGYVVDYFSAVVGVSNMAGVEYTFRSLGADEANDDPYSGVVLDVHAGLTEVALSTFWITSERLQLTPYTTPVTVDQILLWVEQPDVSGGSVSDNISKIFAPFEPSLWITLGVLTIIVAFANIWLSTTRGVHSYLSRRMSGQRWKNGSGWEKSRIVGGMLIDSIMIFSTYIFGHSVELDWQSTRAQKVLLVGYAFLILVAVASYTANLAAFLTVAGVSSYISSMEEAIYTNTPICIHPTLQDELESVWPEATFVVNPARQGTDGMLEFYEAGKCSIIASSMLEVRSNAHLMDEFCKLDLVSTGSLVLENPIAFPVAERYAGGLSYWLFHAEKQGITFDSFAEASYPPLICSLKLSLNDADAELASLSPENFALPFILCATCIILAVLLHFCNKTDTHYEMGDKSHNSYSVSEKGRRASIKSTSARDPIDVDDEHAMMNTQIAVNQGGGGVGAWTEKSLLDHTPEGSRPVADGLTRRNVTISTPDDAPGPAELKRTLHEVLATQQLMLSLFQQNMSSSHKQEESPIAPSMNGNNAGEIVHPKDE